jgi:4-amino-4-deoxy-L-arabinose transferase-like glycosyltransferase
MSTATSSRPDRRRWVGVGALLILFVLLTSTYSLVTPIFEGPDEVWHFAYVRYIAEGYGLPALTDNESGANQEVAQPPLYYAMAAVPNLFVSDEDLDVLMWHNPGFGYQAPGTVNDNKNMLIHTEREAFPWQGAVLAVRLARVVSLAFGVLAVLAAWGLGREAFPDRSLAALGVAAVVAFTPQFLFISGVVSNDSAAAALSTAALWAMARVVNRGAAPRRGLAVGLLIGLAVLTKTSTLLLGPLFVVAVVLATRTSPAPGALKRGMTTLFIAGSVTVLIGGWWYLRNGILYGDPLAVGVHVDTLWGRAEPASLGTLLTELPTVYRTFWGGFGWGHVMFPLWIYLATGTGLAASAAGWVWTLKRRHLVGPGGIFLLSALWWGFVFAALLQWMRQVEAPHGRLLFPAIGAGAGLLVGGWAALPWRRVRTIFLTGLVLLAALTPWLVIRPAFAAPRLVAPEEVTATVTGPELIYGDTARLLGISLEQASVAPGETLAVRACWEALAPMEEEYTVFVHLVGRDELRVAERHTYPGLGRFPTSLWPVGKAFCDTYRLQVEPWSPTPELYDLLLGLYDAGSGERLIARDNASEEVSFPAVAQVRVAPEEPLTVAPEHPLDVRLGDQIALVGYDLSNAIQAGASSTITLYWRAEAEPERNYTVFLQLLDEAGNIVAQHDGPPRHGRYPTAAWQPGDVIPDERVLVVPEIPIESIRLVAGMYDPATMVRLPVSDPQGPTGGDFVLLPSLTSPQ